MFYDSEHEFSDFLKEVENAIKVIRNKLDETSLQPDEKEMIADLCEKISEKIPKKYAHMKTQDVLRQYTMEMVEFMNIFKKLRNYMKIIMDFTDVRLESKSFQVFLHWKKLAEEGNEKAREIYEDMKREFPDIVKRIEDEIGD